jgi:hypothetical protein
MVELGQSLNLFIYFFTKEKGFMKFNETKPASWIEGRIPMGDGVLFAHCTSLTPDKIMVAGLDPSKSLLDRLLTSDPNVMRYNCFLYAFNLEDGGGLCKAHRMSQWAIPGNYAYVFSGSNRRYMSDRKLLKNVEVGFLDDVSWADITAYK